MKIKYLIIGFLLGILFMLIITKCDFSKNIDYGISEGTYVLEGAENSIVPPSITFNIAYHTFSFTYDLLSSYGNTGTWEYVNKKIVATTNDKKYVFIFEIIDNHTISFVQKDSSKITYIDSAINSNPPIVNGTKFVFVKN